MAIAAAGEMVLEAFPVGSIEVACLPHAHTQYAHTHTHTLRKFGKKDYG